MELYDSDLNGFASDLRLEGLVDSTISNHLSCLKRWGLSKRDD